MRILIAEDDSILADGLSRSLRYEGYAVDVVHDGDSADSALQLQSFDLLILDLDLPKKPGLSVLQIDAHADLRDCYMGTRHNHACAMRRSLDYVTSVTQVGIRSMSTEEAREAPGLGTQIFYDVPTEAMRNSASARLVCARLTATRLSRRCGSM